MTTTRTNESEALPYVPSGTRVLNTTDGEPGVVMNGFARDPRAGGWTEYEVATACGIERWQRGDFIRFDEVEAEQRRRNAGAARVARARETRA